MRRGWVICSRQCPNGDGIYTLLYALYKYSTSITNQPTNQGDLESVRPVQQTRYSWLSGGYIWWLCISSSDETRKFNFLSQI